MTTERADTGFWIGSAVIHLILFVVLFLSPAGQKIFTREDRKLKPEIIRKDEELSEVIDQIRDLAVLRLQSQLELLHAGQDRMATNFHTMNAYYQPFVETQLETVRLRLEQEGSKIFERQQELLQAIENAVREKEPASDPMWRAYDRNRAHILAGQEEIRRALLLAAPEETELIELQRQADSNQMEVFSMISSSVNAQNGLWRGTARAEVLEEAIPKGRESLEETEQLLKETTNALPEAKKRLAEAEAAAERLAKSGTAEEKEIESAEKLRRRTTQELASLEKRQRSRTSQRDRLAERLEKNETELRDIKQRPGQLREERDSFAAQALELQKKVMADQQTVYESLLEHIRLEAEKSQNEEPSTEPAKPAEGQSASL